MKNLEQLLKKLIAAKGCSSPQEVEKSRPKGGNFSGVFIIVD